MYLPENFKISWSGYSGHLQQMLQEMFSDEFTDVTLVTDDLLHIQAHKTVLSASEDVP